MAGVLIDAFKFVIDINDDFISKVDEMIEALISHGDLLEISDATTIDPNQKGTWIFATPPAYVPRNNGLIYLLGISPEQISPLPDELEERIEYIEHLRLIRQCDGENLSDVLKELGMTELSEKAWLKSPGHETPESFFESMCKKLESTNTCGELPDLIILDPDKPVDYYPGRWTTVDKKSGYFVAKRARAYGNDIWGFTKLDNGNPKIFLDFPLPNSRYRGCDFAWRLQTAIDRCSKHPQVFRIQDDSDSEDSRIDFFSPVPLWVRRRLDAFGKPCPPSKCLFSYRIPRDSIGDEIHYLENEIWLSRLP
ncbi:hypothetical protein UZ36_06810 [Candidatus Nitromaritima sp. SCGC AAA799-C22]|nr:hypothetical protein UZ36_06810 [Candidatus Nitromaritima sp. SCGC AAA799-C22]